MNFATAVAVALSWQPLAAAAVAMAAAAVAASGSGGSGDDGDGVSRWGRGPPPPLAAPNDPNGRSIFRGGYEKGKKGGYEKGYEKGFAKGEIVGASHPAGPWIGWEKGFAKGLMKGVPARFQGVALSKMQVFAKGVQVGMGRAPSGRPAPEAEVAEWPEEEEDVRRGLLSVEDVARDYSRTRSNALSHARSWDWEHVEGEVVEGGDEGGIADGAMPRRGIAIADGAPAVGGLPPPLFPPDHDYTDRYDYHEDEGDEGEVVGEEEYKVESEEQEECGEGEALAWGGSWKRKKGTRSQRQGQGSVKRRKTRKRGVKRRGGRVGEEGEEEEGEEVLESEEEDAKA